MQNKQKITLYLPQNLHRQLKIRAAVDSEAISAITEREIAFYLTFYSTEADVVEETEETTGLIAKQSSARDIHRDKTEISQTYIEVFQDPVRSSDRKTSTFASAGEGESAETTQLDQQAIEVKTLRESEEQELVRTQQRLQSREILLKERLLELQEQEIRLKERVLQLQERELRNNQKLRDSQDEPLEQPISEVGLGRVETRRGSRKLRDMGDRVIALSSGGAFLGGLIAQVPGAIVGALAGAIVGYLGNSKTTNSTENS
jgi:hypothetical protein